jgi:replication factor C subunit 1
LGDDAGPSKLKAIEKNNLKTLTEDQFLDLIATRIGPSGKGGKVDEKLAKKMEKEQRAIEDGAKELERREREQAKAAKKAQATGSAPKGKAVDVSSQLWTQRYAPQTLKEICGNKGQVEKLQQWLHDWYCCLIVSDALAYGMLYRSGSLKCGFKKPGKNGMNVFRAVMLTGPPGIGKTTSAHLCAKLEGFTPIELNASDARSKKLVEVGSS